jgi:beta-glucanase (GH16 family)
MQMRALYRTIAMCGLLPALSAGAFAHPAPGVMQRSASAPTLLFGDDFPGRTLDAAKWTTAYPWCNPALACPTGGPDDWETYEAGQVQVDNGLSLVATYDGMTYPSGIITTGGTWSPYRAATFAFTYGYAEMRAVFPPGIHAWPAFWLLATKRDDPHEIDIVEGQGAIPNRDYMTVHYPQPGGGSGFDQGTYDNPQSLQGTPHTYAVDWRPNSITWYLDGVARFRDTNAAHIPHQLMYVLVDFAVGGWVRKWNGIPGPDDVFPATMSVSYVRVWNRKP